ncbi:MAG: hypothetical protein H0X65_19290 [Gemmatimonadetes bacterium]|nr:hypothetical protein [Gemmatimonadota bacterium]
MINKVTPLLYPALAAVVLAACVDQPLEPTRTGDTQLSSSTDVLASLHVQPNSDRLIPGQYIIIFKQDVRDVPAPPNQSLQATQGAACFPNSVSSYACAPRA